MRLSTGIENLSHNLDATKGRRSIARKKMKDREDSDKY
jgi:hypothetical protein